MSSNEIYIFCTQSTLQDLSVIRALETYMQFMYACKVDAWNCWRAPWHSHHRQTVLVSSQPNARWKTLSLILQLLQIAAVSSWWEVTEYPSELLRFSFKCEIEEVYFLITSMTVSPQRPTAGRHCRDDVQQWLICVTSEELCFPLDLHKRSGVRGLFESIGPLMQRATTEI